MYMVETKKTFNTWRRVTLIIYTLRLTTFQTFVAVAVKMVQMTFFENVNEKNTTACR